MSLRWKIAQVRWKIAQAFEIRWWQHYLRDKSTEEYREWKHDYWTNFLKKIDVRPVPDATVMDIGCGPAGVFMVLAQQRVDALDPLLADYEKKLTHFHPSQYPKVQFHPIPFEDFSITEPYDYVFCLNAINHVADLEKCMDKLVKVCKPGGTIILSIDAHNHGALKSIFRMIPGDILHPHQYDLTEYQEMLTSRGCVIENTVLYKPEFIFNYYVLVATNSNPPGS